MSGLLSLWVIELWQAMPRLLRLVHDLGHDWANGTGAWWRHTECSMGFMTFTNGIDTLYHARYLGGEWGEEMCLLGPHFMSYTSINMETSAKFDMQYDWKRPSDHRFSHVTYYRGYPLPLALLDHICRISGLVLEWREAGRDLSMVDEAWELLAAWREEVEREKGQRGDVKITKHLTAPDLHDMEFGNCAIRRDDR